MCIRDSVYTLVCFDSVSVVREYFFIFICDVLVYTEGTEYYEYTRQDRPVSAELVGISLRNGRLPHPQTTMEL